MKYSIEFSQAHAFHAGFKAVDDVTQLIHEMGYLPYVIGRGQSNHIFRGLSTVVNILKFYTAIKKDDICFMQWPSGSRTILLLYYILLIKRVKMQLLIHDLSSIRYGIDDTMEMKFLRHASLIIAHTPSMRDLLLSKGIPSNKVELMTTFDYFFNIHLNCYGKKVVDIKSPLIYKGVFEPDDVNGIEGSWGLVWDGDSIETCTGMYGNYMRINSPHKVSLYIAARLPIIIWEEAAIAPYIKEKGLGVLIGSLLQIPKVLQEFDNTRYEHILANIDKERNQLIKGEHLKRCLT